MRCRCNLRWESSRPLWVSCPLFCMFLCQSSLTLRWDWSQLRWVFGFCLGGNSRWESSRTLWVWCHAFCMFHCDVSLTLRWVWSRLRCVFVLCLGCFLSVALLVFVVLILVLSRSCHCSLCTLLHRGCWCAYRDGCASVSMRFLSFSPLCTCGLNGCTPARTSVVVLTLLTRRTSWRICPS